MRVRINGGDIDISGATTVEGLLDTLGIQRCGIAVELNREVVPKRLLSATAVKDGDVIEIIRMVGGG